MKRKAKQQVDQGKTIIQAKKNNNRNRRPPINYRSLWNHYSTASIIYAPFFSYPFRTELNIMPLYFQLHCKGSHQGTKSSKISPQTQHKQITFFGYHSEYEKATSPSAPNNWAATLIYAVPMQAQHKERIPWHLDKASIAAIGESKMHIGCSVPGAGLHPVSWYRHAPLLQSPPPPPPLHSLFHTALSCNSSDPWVDLWREGRGKGH